jgi:hypothetical protein
VTPWRRRLVWLAAAGFTTGTLVAAVPASASAAAPVDQVTSISQPPVALAVPAMAACGTMGGQAAASLTSPSPVRWTGDQPGSAGGF